MVLYTECVDAKSASLDGSVRIRHRQLGVGARDGTPPSHSAYAVIRLLVRAPVPGTDERPRMEPTMASAVLNIAPEGNLTRYLQEIRKFPMLTPRRNCHSRIAGGTTKIWRRHTSLSPPICASSRK